MTAEAPFSIAPEGPQEAVRIRSPRRVWIGNFFVAVPFLLLALGQAWVGWPELALGYLLVSALWVALGLWMRTRGVDLTQESVVVHAVRRRSIPWSQVQAVLRQVEPLGTWAILLILHGGERVVLRLPTTVWGGSGGAEYERSFHRIGQWWLAHRGASWRPERPEAPTPGAELRPGPAASQPL
jgi:hypothetical protein